jgi:hypothetical protein
MTRRTWTLHRAGRSAVHAQLRALVGMTPAAVEWLTTEIRWEIVTR